MPRAQSDPCPHWLLCRLNALVRNPSFPISKRKLSSPERRVPTCSPLFSSGQSPVSARPGTAWMSISSACTVAPRHASLRLLSSGCAPTAQRKRKRPAQNGVMRCFMIPCFLTAWASPTGGVDHSLTRSRAVARQVEVHVRRPAYNSTGINVSRNLT